MGRRIAKNILLVLVVGGLLAGNLAFHGAFAATDIVASSTDHFSWNDLGGWWDFYSTGNVWLSSKYMKGWAVSPQIGEISFDCGTSPIGNICASSNYGVCNGLAATHNATSTCANADASGFLSGYAWNDRIGWISFSCHNADPYCLTGPGYWGVRVDQNTGEFSGWAWNDLVGWIDFNCANLSTCGTSDFRVASTWQATSTIATLDSGIIDTQVQGGATLNSVTWIGVQKENGEPGTTFVDFQIAASQSADGPWSFIGPGGNDRTYFSLPCAASWAGGMSPDGNAPEGVPICINPAQVKDMRYLRYRVRLRSNLMQDDGPRVDNVILNWAK